MNWFRKVEDAIRKIIKEFMENPYVFIYEADIQARLYSLIGQGVRNGDWFIRTAVINNDIMNVQTTPIHTQLAINAQSSEKDRGKRLKQHLDIGIWDITNETFNQRNYGEKPILIGIEIKYHWARIFKRVSDRHKLIAQHLADIDKLAGLKSNNPDFVGHALWFLPQMEIANFPEPMIRNLIRQKIRNIGGLCSWIILNHEYLKVEEAAVTYEKLHRY